MPNSYSASELLSVFSDVYRGVDIRCVVARENERWLLIALSAHINFEDDESGVEEFRYRLGVMPGLETSNVTVHQQNVELGTLSALAKAMGAGKLPLGRIEIDLSGPRDILTQPMYMQQPPIFPAGSKKWPQLRHDSKLKEDNDAVRFFLNDVRLSRATELGGYRTPEDAVRELLSVPFTSNNIGGLWITFDIPVRLLKPAITIKHNRQVLAVTVEAHSAVSDVACAVRVTDLGRELRRPPVAPMNKTSQKGSVATWEADVVVEVQRGELLEIDVLCDKAGRLYSVRMRAEELLPIRITNPLYAALTLFCSPEQMRSLVLEPETTEAPNARKKPEHRASLFEISTQWLFSLLGFQSIWLHGFEIARKGKVEIGAVDCLAFSERERLLLLINCSLGAPDPTELNKHEAFRAAVAEMFAADTDIKVLSVVVTAAAGKTNDAARNPSLVILNKPSLETLRSAVESGQLVDFATLANPILRDRFIDA